MLKNLLSAARDVYNEFNLSFQLKININMPDCCGRLPLIEAIARCGVDTALPHSYQCTRGGQILGLCSACLTIK